LRLSGGVLVERLTKIAVLPQPVLVGWLQLRPWCAVRQIAAAIATIQSANRARSKHDYVS
jgi:hypothetical protein